MAFEHATVLRYRHVVVEHHQPPVGNLTVLLSRHDRPHLGTHAMHTSSGLWPRCRPAPPTSSCAGVHACGHDEVGQGLEAIIAHIAVTHHAQGLWAMRLEVATSHLGSRCKSRSAGTLGDGPTPPPPPPPRRRRRNSPSAALVVTVHSVRRVSTPPIRPRVRPSRRDMPRFASFTAPPPRPAASPARVQRGGVNPRRLRSSQSSSATAMPRMMRTMTLTCTAELNRSAIKRLIDEYKGLTKELCALPKTSVAKIQMPDELREEVYAAISILATSRVNAPKGG